MAQFFFDDFETDDFSLWGTDNSGAKLFTSAASALAGSFGCEIDSGCFGCTNDVSQELTAFTIGTALRVGFKFSRNDITFTSGQYINAVDLTPLSFGSILETRIINDAAVFKIQAVCIDDSAAEHIAEAQISSGTKNIEIRLVSATGAATNNGSVHIYVDTVLIDSATGIDNHTKYQDLSGGNLSMSAEQNNGDASSGSMYFDNITLRDDDTPIFPSTPDQYVIAPMTKPCDIDASSNFLYIAALDGGTPILIKFSAGLDLDGTNVFDPGSGNNIGVECGRFDADVVWVAGNFDGTNVVEKSEDAGSTFVVKDDATIGDIRTFVLGPDTDKRLLVFDETNGDILETIDNGATWTTINASVTPEINAIDRLPQNVQESVFGNGGGASDSINYSVNSGDDLEDFQTGVYPNANATGIIVN